MGVPFKSLGMLLPPVRRLHEERNRYAQEVGKLNQRLLAEDQAFTRLKGERDSLYSENIALGTKIEQLNSLLANNLSQRLHIDGGKPLLNRASTAVDMLRKTQMDAAWIEGWLFSKTSQLHYHDR